MITDEQISALVRVGMQYSPGWALMNAEKIPYLGGTLIRLTLSLTIVDTTLKTVYITPNGVIEKL